MSLVNVLKKENVALLLVIDDLHDQISNLQNEIGRLREESDEQSAEIEALRGKYRRVKHELANTMLKKQRLELELERIHAK